jgi:hypothetical protein
VLGTPFSFLFLVLLHRFHSVLRNLAVGWVVLVSRSLEVPNLNPGPGTGYPN